MRIFSYMIAGLLTLGCAASPAAREPAPLTPAAGPAGVRAGRAGQASQPQASEQARHAEAASLCAMMSEGARVAVEDVHEGVAVVLTTNGDVSALRVRVRVVVKMHESHHPLAAQAMSSGGTSAPTAGGDMMMPHAMMMTGARAEDVDRGMRIVLSPHDRAALEELRGSTRELVARMNQGRCGTQASPTGTPLTGSPSPAEQLPSRAPEKPPVPVPAPEPEKPGVKTP